MFHAPRQHLGVNAAMQKELLRGIKKREAPAMQQGSVGSIINLPTTYHSSQSAQAVPIWAYHLLPSLYSHYQKVQRHYFRNHMLVSCNLELFLFFVACLPLKSERSFTYSHIELLSQTVSILNQEEFINQKTQIV